MKLRKRQFHLFIWEHKARDDSWEFYRLTAGNFCVNEIYIKEKANETDDCERNIS